MSAMNTSFSRMVGEGADSFLNCQTIQIVRKFPPKTPAMIVTKSIGQTVPSLAAPVKKEVI